MAAQNLAAGAANIPEKRPGGGRRHGQPVVKPRDMKGTVKRLTDTLKGDRKGLILILIFAVLSSAAGIFSPLVIGRAITAINNGNAVLLFILLLGGIYASNFVVNLLQGILMAVFSQKVTYRIRTRLFNTMVKLPLSFFDTKQHGELMSRLTNDVDNISSTIADSLSQLLSSIFSMTGILIVMINLSLPLTLVALIGTAAIVILTKIVTGITRPLFVKQQKDLGLLNGHIQETISGIFIVKAFGREQAVTDDFDVLNDRLTKTAEEAQIKSGFIMPAANVINNVSFVAISVISAGLAVQGVLSVGLITSFLLYIRQFSRPFVEISNIYNNLQTAIAGAERIFEITDTLPEPADRGVTYALDKPEGDIVFKNVVFGYNREKPILKGIDLEVPAGTKVAVVGPTGAGKTTLINLLTRFYDVDSGSITLDGHDLRDYKMSDLRKAFDVVLQDTVLFAETVRYNIAYGNEHATLDDIKKAARVAGADSFIERMPHGYNTILERSGAELSHGERQLITIARAVLSNAPIMILDEATSSVDTLTEKKIQKALLSVTEGRTSFIIAHRLSTIKDADMIIVIADGQIAEKGTHDELIALGGRYARMHEAQTGE